MPIPMCFLISGAYLGWLGGCLGLYTKCMKETHMEDGVHTDDSQTVMLGLTHHSVRVLIGRRQPLECLSHKSTTRERVSSFPSLFLQV